jgi:hypothetical protein
MSGNTFKQVPILVSSLETSGAYNVNSDRSKFDIDFAQELVFPKEAKNITLEVSNSSLWYTSYNISAALANNKFYLDVDTDAVYTITIPDGLYDLSSVAHAINVSIVNQGLVSDLITFVGDNSTQKVIVNLSVAGLRIDWTGANSCREIMGFNSAVNPAAYTTAALSVYGDNAAAFNTIDYFLIHSSLVNGGIPVSGKSTSVISRVLISSPPGTQIISEPFNPIKISAQHLAGSQVSRAHFWITTQDGVTSPDFNSENFSVLIVIRYQL